MGTTQAIPFRVATADETRSRLEELLAPWRVERTLRDAGYDRGIELTVEGVCDWLRFIDSQATRFEINTHGADAAFYIKDYGGDMEGTGLSIQEAAQDLLIQVLERTCLDCRGWDGHDATCAFWRDDERGQVELLGRIEDHDDAHYCRDGDTFAPALGRLTFRDDGRVACHRCGWPFSGYELGVHAG